MDEPDDFWPKLPESAAMPTTADDRISPASWAQDVLWAAERINLKSLHPNTEGKRGRPNTSCPAGISVSRFALWQFGRDNPKDMMTNLVPKALAIVQKNTARDDDEAIAAAEEMEVSKMRKTLELALVEAASQ